MGWDAVFLTPQLPSTVMRKHIIDFSENIDKKSCKHHFTVFKIFAVL